MPLETAHMILCLELPNVSLTQSRFLLRIYYLQRFLYEHGIHSSKLYIDYHLNIFLIH